MVKNTRTKRTRNKKAYVIGAGMSGLSVALRLSELGVDTVVIEKETSVGGLAGSFSWGEFKYLDYGPHIYHTPDKRLQAIWEREYGDLFYKNEFWGKNVKGEKFDQYFDYPLSFDSLKNFPHTTRKKILDELGRVDEVNRAKAQSYSAYVRELVGPTLMEFFFVQYPQKLWGISIEKMTANWAPKRINLRTKHEHFHAGQWSAVGKYGSGKIMERMATKFKKHGGILKLGTTIESVGHTSHTLKSLKLSSGSTIVLAPEDIVISTMPLPVMAEHVGIKNNLRYRGAKLVYVALNKERVIPNEANFLYYDASDVLFHRVSEPKKFSSMGFPKGKTVLVCEVAYTKGDALDRQSENKTIARVVEDLCKVGLVTKKDVLDTKLISQPYVYPVTEKGSEAELTEVRGKLAAFKQLYGIGTGGDFHYADLQILNLKGIDLAERLAVGASAEHREMIKQDYTKDFNKTVQLGAHVVSEGTPAFIIAEAGLNHNGSVVLALELIDRAAEAGCSAIKFQTYRAANRVSKEVKGNRYAEELIDTEESTFNMLERLELTLADHKKLFAHAQKRGIEIFSTPFDENSVDLLESLGCKFYKISSMDLVNLPLIRKVAQTGKPLIMSTGMSTLSQIEDAVHVVRETGNRNLILLHCVSSYPAAPGDMNLKVMDTLRQTFGVPVGLSDHAIGITVASIALARGAQVIERHFTLDRFMEGPDHILSSDVDEMRELVRMAHLVPVVEGRGEKIILPSETDTIHQFKKCLYAKRDIKRGQKITSAAVTIKGPGGGILPKYADIVVGKIARNAIAKDHPIRWEDI